jgi:DNA topoisomerase-1
LSSRRRKGGWSRSGRRRFSYYDARGRRIADEAALERLAGLAIPPAWEDVWISPSPGARLQATGFDAAGRKQYLYHPDFRARRDREKFERLVAFGAALPAVRKQAAADLAAEPLAFEWTSAIATTLVNRSWFRPGSEQAARTSRTYGVTTLTKRHVRVRGRRLTFCFRGKSRVLHRTTVVDEELADAVRRLASLEGGARLFRFEREETLAPLTAPLLNEYLRGSLDDAFSVKDFRTWGGTLTAAIALAEHGPPASAADEKRALAAAFRAVGRELGNTPAVARSSYVSPVVVERFHEGLVLETVRPREERVLSAAATGLSPEEQSLLRLLGEA